MHYVKQFNINGVDTAQIACIELRGKPNAATEGAVGVLGIDVVSPTHEVYKCVAVNGGVYTWELLSAGMSIISATISRGGAQNTQFYYANLLMPTNYIIKVGDLILDSKGYLYQVTVLAQIGCAVKYCGTQIGGLASGNENCRMRVEDGKLQLVTESGDVVSEIDYFLPDDETTYRDSATGASKIIGVESIDGTTLKFFVGTKSEYDALTDAQKENLFPIIRAGQANTLWEDAIPNPRLERLLSLIMDGATVGLDYDYYGSGYRCKGRGFATDDYITIAKKFGDTKVLSIYSSAFSGDSKIYYLSIPSNITTIGGYAFDKCSNLAYIDIGTNVTTIGNYAFNECKNLSSIEFMATRCNDFQANNRVFYQAGISSAGFNLNISSNVTTIPSYMFYPYENRIGVVRLRSVNFRSGSKCTRIGAYSFYGCTYLETIEFPSGLTEIGMYAFDSCRNLTTVSIPKSVTYIGERAFGSCPITDVYYEGTQSEWEAISGVSNAKITETATIHYNSW